METDVGITVPLTAAAVAVLVVIVAPMLGASMFSAGFLAIVLGTIAGYLVAE